MLQQGLLHGVYSIPRHAAFLHSLAAGLRAAYGDTPHGLANALLLLPNRRSARSLQEIFLNQAVDDNGVGSAILPRMLAFADAATDTALAVLIKTEMPPPLSSYERLLQLSLFVEKQDASLSSAQVLALARDLARLFDELALYNVDLTQLPELVEKKDLAEHWQHTLRFINIITGLWPQYLHTVGRSDPGAYKAACLRGLVNSWKDQPPQYPVIMAGLSRAEPLLLDVAKAVLGMPAGAVVLPGFDASLPHDIWANLDVTHPDSLLEKLLLGLKLQRGDVKTWPATDAEPSARQAWLSMAMLPANYTRNWVEQAPKVITPDSIDNVTVVKAEDEVHETTLAALMIRAALEKEQSVSLITANRTLARRVAALLRRWGIHADDSSGQPFVVSRLAVYLRLLASACMPTATAVDLLALLKHPLCSVDANVAVLETAVFRGYYPAPGFQGLVKHLEKHQHQALAAVLAEACGGLAAALATKKQPAKNILRAHIEAAEHMAGGAAIWQGADGEAGSEALSFILESVPDGLHLQTADYMPWLMQLLQPVAVRVPYGLHPRVSIHGLIEARLQKADVTILAGLAEGVWPALPAPSLWLNRSMRAALGLPSPDEVIAEEANDFVTALTAKKVFLLYPARQNGTPTVPTRWLRRLLAVLPQSLQQALGKDAEEWRTWAHKLDQASAVVPMAAPAPCPPVGVRPRDLSVTDVELLMRNPYGLYAKKILQLKKLDDLGDEPGANERGTFLHESFANFTEATAGRPLAPHDKDLLLECGRKTLQAYSHLPGVQAFWWPWYVDMCDWWWQQQAATPERRHLSAEKKGRHTWPDWPGGAFTLRAKADRIDHSKDTITLVDYKTGSVPAPKAIRKGISPQLLLEAVLLSAGGFESIAPAVHIKAEYWHMAGSSKKCRVQAVPVDVTLTESALKDLVAAFSTVGMPYYAGPVVANRPTYDDYQHLARYAEWAADSAEDEAA